MEERLLQMGAWLGVNGEAIYGTRAYVKKPQSGVYYTQKANAVYAISERFPFDALTLEEIPYRPDAKATLLAAPDAPIGTADDGGKLRLVFPRLNPDDLKADLLYAFRID